MDEKETKKKIRGRCRVGDHFAAVVFCRRRKSPKASSTVLCRSSWRLERVDDWLDGARFRWRKVPIASSLENARRRFHPTMRSFVFQIRPVADIFIMRRSRKFQHVEKSFKGDSDAISRSASPEAKVVVIIIDECVS